MTSGATDLMTLQSALDLGRRALDLDQNHDLGLGYRQLIWAALGPRLDPEEHPYNLGLRRRAELGLRAAERVLPVWSSSRPNDPLPQSLLRTARACFSGEVSRKSAWSAVDAALARFENEVTSSHGPQLDLEVLSAATQALVFSLRDAPFDPDHIDMSLTEGNIDTLNLDPAFYAAGVWAGGTVWDEHSDPSRRREFWTWWLTEVVPAAAEVT